MADSLCSNPALHYQVIATRRTAAVRDYEKASWEVPYIAAHTRASHTRQKSVRQKHMKYFLKWKKKPNQFFKGNRK